METHGKLLPRHGTMAKGYATRTLRYATKALAPDGPLRADQGLSVEDFFHEPVYQMLRQIMLAWQMQKHGEDQAVWVLVLHVSLMGNKALHKMTAPNLPAGDVSEAFRGLLVDPDMFIPMTKEALFAGLLRCDLDDPDLHAWRSYVGQRNALLSEHNK